MEQTTGEAPQGRRVEFVNFLSASEVSAAKLASMVEETTADTTATTTTATEQDQDPEEEFEIELVDSGTTEEPVVEDVTVTHDAPSASHPAESNTIRQRRAVDPTPNVEDSEAKAGVNNPETTPDKSK